MEIEDLMRLKRAAILKQKIEGNGDYSTIHIEAEDKSFDLDWSLKDLPFYLTEISLKEGAILLDALFRPFLNGTTPKQPVYVIQRYRKKRRQREQAQAIQCPVDNWAKLDTPNRLYPLSKGQYIDFAEQLVEKRSTRTPLSFANGHVLWFCRWICRKEQGHHKISQ